MQKAWLERILIAAGFGAVAALGILTVLAWLDYRHPSSDVARAAGTTVQTQVAAPKRTEIVRRTRRSASAGAGAILVLRATRGDSWISVHAGSESGESLFEGVLAQSKSRRFARKALWIRLGAPLELDATLNGRAVQLPTYTATLLAAGGRLKTVG